MNARNFFSGAEKERIVAAIRAAENDTSGEVRVHVSERCPAGALNSAAYWFGKLKMHHTQQRNGILFYLAIKDRQFAIVGDVGINSLVPENFWDHISERMQANFQHNLFVEGLDEGIRMAGKQLKEYFPRHADDVNELSDEISFS